MNLCGVLRSLLLGLLAGPILAWALALVVYYVPAQEAALRRGGAESFAVWPLALIGAAGALVGAITAVTIGKRRLPPAVKHAAIGAMAGVAGVVVATLTLAHMLGGSSSPGQGPYLHWGRVCAVPVGVVGGLLGWVIGSRCSLGGSARPRWSGT